MSGRGRRRGLTVREALLLQGTGGQAERAPVEGLGQRRSSARGGSEPVPDVFVIGAMRAGTTTFCADLGTQPQIFVPLEKEPWILVRSLGDQAIAREMYRELYRQAPPGARLVDGSTSNAKRPEHPRVAALAAAISPGASVIYLVRNPVHRAISHYRHALAMGLSEEPDLGRAMARDPTLIDFGRYRWQLTPWLSAFGPHAVKVVLFEEYVADRRTVIRETVEFLGLDPSQVTTAGGAILNRSSEARALRGSWQRLVLSETYRSRVRKRIPTPARVWLRDTLLPKAPLMPGPVPLVAVDEMIDACREDAAELASLLGRSEPLWDWDATRQEFQRSRPSTSQDGVSL